MKLLRELLAESYTTDLQDEVWHVFRKKMSKEEQDAFLEKEGMDDLSDIYGMDVESLEYLLNALSSEQSANIQKLRDRIFPTRS